MIKVVSFLLAASLIFLIQTGCTGCSEACKSDLDCKGLRICTNNECIDPKPENTCPVCEECKKCELCKKCEPCDTSSSPNCEFVRFNGRIDNDRHWKSAWIDVTPPMELPSGTKVRVKVGGTAQRMILRVLRVGDDENTLIGVTGDIIDIPENREVEVTLDNTFSNVRQISVHGGSNPFGSFPMGDENGHVTLISASYCSNR